MKFWKHTLLTAFAFIGITSMVLYTSCEKDSCADLNCQNGGSCTAGFCHCATGYEGTNCEIRSVDRYLGRYYGVTDCDSTPGLIDTTDIILSSNLTSVGVVQHTNITDTVYGAISTTPNQYSITVPNVVNGGYSRTETITLINNKLTVSVVTVNNSVSTTCTFIGAQH